LFGYVKIKKVHGEKKEAIALEDGFFSRVYAIVARIPKGKVVSYGQIARALGCPRAARQVGWAMRCCPAQLPWHRVVKSDGTIAGADVYAAIRRARLEEENIVFLKDGRVNMQVCAWCMCDEEEPS
jgi:methylated-DNA-protein-cysteine methyltransferase-like protein